jgi:hypothetical protein
VTPNDVLRAEFTAFFDAGSSFVIRKARGGLTGVSVDARGGDGIFKRWFSESEAREIVRLLLDRAES